MLRDKVANKLADIAIYRPKVVIGVFAVLTLVSLVLAGSISVLASTDELLGEDNRAGQRFTEITDNFGSTGTLVVAIEGPDRQTMIDAAHRTVELTERREQIMQHVRAIDLTVDPDYALEWGLMLSDDASDIEDVQTLLAQRSLVDFLTAVNDRYENVVLEDDDQFATNQDEWEGAQALAGIELFTRTLEASVAGKPLPPDVAPEHDPDREDDSVHAEALIHTFFAGDAYSWSPEGDMLTFTIRPSFPLDDLDATGDTVYGLREVAAEVEQEMDEVRIGIGGEIAQNQDEQDAISADMLIPSVVALILIVALFAFSFAKFRNIFFAIISLVVGILLTVGGIAVTVGHLSFITSIFAVILIGLGIDFGIHLVSNYDDSREKGYDPATAIRKVMHAGGTPIMLGGITTAAAFFTLAVARMPAIAEFGIIAGMGVLLTLAAMMLLLPALMLSFGGRSKVGSLRRRFMINYGFMAAIGGAVVRHRIVTIALVAAATVFAATMIPQNRIDYDMMNIGPSSGPAVDTQRRIMDRMEVSPFTAITTTDSVEEARELGYYRQISSVDPAITGSVPLFVALVDDVFTDGSQAALWAALVVFAVMLAIFRRVGHVLLAFGSVAVAIVWMFGILPLLGMRLQANAAMVFPLLIGIGTDFAMHILHRYDHEGGDIVSTLRYSGKAVLLSSVTTMLGFGSLALVGQVGMISALGTLLFVGIAACLVATVVALPAFLGIGKRAGYSETSNS